MQLKLLKITFSKICIIFRKIFTLPMWLYLYFIFLSAIISAFVKAEKRLILRLFSIGKLTGGFPRYNLIYFLENK